MKIITSDEFEYICQQEGAKILKTLNDGRPKILETDDEIIKIFYTRNKWFSRWKNRRAVMKFCKNSKKLAEKGVSAPIVSSVLYCPLLEVYVICYNKLPGTNLRIITKQGQHDILTDVATFIAGLHQMGIFFRSLHLENLLLQDNGHFALVDIVDVRFRRYPLNIFLRYRNIKHIFSIHQDHAIWKEFGYGTYLRQYYQKATLSDLSKIMMTWMISYKLT